MVYTKLLTVRAQLLGMATIKLSQVLVRLLFEFLKFLHNKLQKNVGSLFESGYKSCAASSHARTVYLDIG